MGKEYKNMIQKHTYSTPRLVLESIDNVLSACMEELDPLQPCSIKKIIITGCGYSYAAALTLKDYLSETVQRPVLILPAIEVSRFSHESAGDYAGTLLIAISNSGEVSRLNEAVLLYKKHNAAVIGLTANRHSPIAQHSDYIIDISSPSIGSGLPLRGYTMTLLALLCIGYCLKQKSKTESCHSISSEIKELKDTMQQLEIAMPEIDQAVLRYLENNPQISSFEFVGSGYERGAAFLGKIEMLGQAGIIALDEDCEQWCHCNFFMAKPEKIGTILFYASDSPASSRSREALSYMIHLHRPVCLVTDDPTIPENESYSVIRLPKITNKNAGLLEMVVPSLLTGYYCDQIGETYSRGFRNQWEMFQTGCGTCQSEIIVL